MTARWPDRDEAAYYEFRIEGRLDTRWATWFEGLAFSHDDGVTTLRGVVVDQAALHGVLARLRDLGVTLLSMRTLDDPEIRGEGEGRPASDEHAQTVVPDQQHDHREVGP